MSTLSILHDATMEKLTSSTVYSDVEIGTSSSNQSPVKSHDISDVDSPIRYQPRVKTPDFELYGDKSDDHDMGYEDTMYKLAYLSPIPSEKCSDSPPRPLSPKEMLKLDGTVEQLNDKTEHTEQILTFADVLKTVQTGADSNMDVDINKSAESLNPSSKIAVAKTETLTLKDIKSLCQVEKEDESNAGIADDEDDKAIDSTPPDLGPPALESSPNPDKLDDGSPPPQLTPNKSGNEISFEQALKNELLSSESERNLSTPPCLVSCLSPQLSLSPEKNLSVSETQAQDVSAEDFLNHTPEKDTIDEGSKLLPECSSGGSINVIHSEEFSDISDSEDESGCAGKRTDKTCKPKYTDSPTMPCLSPRLRPEIKGILFEKDIDCDKQQKLREIKEFEERFRKVDVDKSRKSDENRNNIFELMSTPNSNVWNGMDESSVRRPPSTPNHHEVDGMNPKMFNLKQIQGSNPDILKFKERLKNSFHNVGDNHDAKPYLGDKSSENPLNGDKDFVPTQSASKLLYNMSQNHTNSKIHMKNGELGFVRPHGPVKNGTYQRSLSQNDYFQHFNQRHSSMEDLMNCSMELNYAALERTENGKHGLNHRNFFTSYSQPRLKTSEIGVNSGDLFESSSDLSRISCEKSFPAFNRSLSDSARSEYSIIRCNRLNDSIVKSVHNISSRDKTKLDFNYEPCNNVPFNEFGSGDGKKGSRSHNSGNKSANNRSGGKGHAGLSLSDRHNTSDDSGNGGDNNGHRHKIFYGSSNPDGCNVITPFSGPPSLEKILESANQHGLAAYQQTSAFYSNYRDMPEKPRYTPAEFGMPSSRIIFLTIPHFMLSKIMLIFVTILYLVSMLRVY